MLAISNKGPGIGDKVQFGYVPENHFLNTGEKVIDISKSFVFDYNPYIIREYKIEDITHYCDLWSIRFPTTEYQSLADRMSNFLGWRKCYLRHPRLYQFEDIDIQPRTVIVHTNGKMEGGIMSDKTIETIYKNYKGWEITQLGGINDRDTPFKKSLGTSFWESAKLIASSQIFISVNSSMMNIANCYPKIHRKVVIIRDDLPKYYLINKGYGWIDYNWSYYNETEYDIGITMSYKKI